MSVELDIASIADDPARRAQYEQLDGHWPGFMTRDPSGALYFHDNLDVHPGHALVAIDRETGEAVARAVSIPIHHTGDLDDGLPEGGWDWAIRRAVYDRFDGLKPTMVSALEILIRTDRRGAGLAPRMLAAMRANVARMGYRDLVAPVRPSGKHAYPTRPIDEYAWAKRDDGWPADSWLRVHVRAGARILNVCHSSMVIPGTLAQWREWTGLPFDTDGPVLVPGALTPVHCDLTQNTAVYVEPNVWVHHDLRDHDLRDHDPSAHDPSAHDLSASATA